MRLKEFLQAEQLSAEKFARHLGCVTGQAVRCWAKGSRMPEPLIAEKIVEVTKGKVTVQDLHDARMTFLRSETTEAA